MHSIGSEEWPDLFSANDIIIAVFPTAQPPTATILRPRSAIDIAARARAAPTRTHPRSPARTRLVWMCACVDV